MYSWWKRIQSVASGPQSEEDPVAARDEPGFPHGYEGEGVWYRCDERGSVHEIEEAPAYRGLIEDLCRSVSQSSDEAYDRFGIRGEGRWDVIEREGLFKFTNADGRVAMGPYGVVASWNDKTHSWLWTWAMPDDWIELEARKVCARLKERAEEEGNWEPVERGTLYVNEHEAWHLTNLAAWVSDMPMVYRARVNEKNWHYFAIGPLKWTN